MADAGEVKITVELDDLGTIEATGKQRTWMCLADRVRFEKQFSTNAGVIHAWSDLYESDDEGNRKLKDGADVAPLREEYMAFFAWCELRRRVEGIPDYDAFIDQVLSIDIEHGADADPTSAAKPTTS